MTYLLELKKEYALPILEVLQQQEAITLQPANESVIKPRRKANFDLVKLDTRGYKFNRDEANI